MNSSTALAKLDARPVGPKDAKSRATHPWRIPLHAGRTVPTHDPQTLAEALTAENPRCMLAKERSGCLSLWRPRAGKRSSTRGCGSSSRSCEGRQLRRRPHRPSAIAGPIALHAAPGGRASRAKPAAGARRLSQALGVERDPPENEVLVVARPCAWKYGNRPRGRPTWSSGCRASAVCFIGFQDNGKKRNHIRPHGRTPFLPRVTR